MAVASMLVAASLAVVAPVEVGVVDAGDRIHLRFELVENSIMEEYSRCTEFRFLVNLDGRVLVDWQRPFYSHSRALLRQHSRSSPVNGPSAPPRMQATLSLLQCRHRVTNRS
jgi:hypothetical protein